MEFFDTHAHFEPSLEYVRELLSRAREAGVTRVLAVGGSDELAAGASLAVAVAAEDLGKYPIVGKSVGWDRDQLDKSPESLSFEGAVALGEIGLDYHYSPETRKAQMELFARQLEIARSRDLPVIIHTREADDDTLGILREIPSHGVIHSFTGNTIFCRQLLDLGFSISMSGIVTFRAAENVRESARLIPLDRLLIETDTPYLAPVPMRGNPNEPQFVVHTARFLADFYSMDLEDLAAATTANAIQLFRFGGKEDA